MSNILIKLYVTHYLQQGWAGVVMHGTHSLHVQTLSGQQLQQFIVVYMYNHNASCGCNDKLLHTVMLF